MYGNAFNTKPLEWEVYKSLMRRMDQFIEDCSDFKKIKYAKYQTSIALGCNLGLNSQQLIRFRWIEIVGVDYYVFMGEERRPPVSITPELSRIADKNYRIIKPSSTSHLVINSSLSSKEKPVNARTYNTILGKMFTQFGIDIPMPCAQTLRRTYARKKWRDAGQTEEAIERISQELDYSIPIVRNYVQLSKY